MGVGSTDVESWSEILEPDATLYEPVMPHQGSEAASESRRELIGVENIAKDAGAMTELLGEIRDFVDTNYGTPDGPRAADCIGFAYAVEPSDLLVASGGHTMMGSWTLKITGMKNFGSEIDCKVSGMLKAKFSATGLISAMNIIFDVRGLMNQLWCFGLIPAIPNEELCGEANNPAKRRKRASTNPKDGSRPADTPEKAVVSNMKPMNGLMPGHMPCWMPAMMANQWAMASMGMMPPGNQMIVPGGKPIASKP